MNHDPFFPFPYSQGWAGGTAPTPNNADINLYRRDHLGSIREVFNPVQGVIQRQDFDFWGRRAVRFAFEGAEWSDLAYTGHPYHVRSGLHLAPYRAYSAELGRWLSRDPIGEGGGSNLYGYVSDPLMWVDPFGLEWHHLLPAGVFGGMEIEGVDINSAAYGWEIDAGAHRLDPGNLHSSGWNTDWQSWLDDMKKSGKRITKHDLDCQLQVMKDKYWDLLKVGSQSKRKYPGGNRRLSRRMGRGGVYSLLFSMMSGAPTDIAAKAAQLMKDMEAFYATEDFSEEAFGAAAIAEQLGGLFGVPPSVAAGALLESK